MKIFGINGKLVNLKVHEYIINWEKESCSYPQTKVKRFLFAFWRNDIVLEEFRIPNSLLRCDFFNITRRIVVEVDGKGVHDEYNKFFHGNRLNYLNSIKRDYQKEQWLKLNKIKFARIKEEDLDKLSNNFFEENFKLSLI